MFVHTHEFQSTFEPMNIRNRPLIDRSDIKHVTFRYDEIPPTCSVAACSKEFQSFGDGLVQSGSVLFVGRRCTFTSASTRLASSRKGVSSAVFGYVLQPAAECFKMSPKYRTGVSEWTVERLHYLDF